jgi:ribosome assembly protein 4
MKRARPSAMASGRRLEAAVDPSFVALPPPPPPPPADEPAAPESILIQFTSMDGAALGPPLDVPATATPRQLELLVRKLLAADAPFTFYLNADELLGALWGALRAQGLTAEAVHAVRYQQLSSFRVMPVTRCSDSLPGHSDAVLHVSFAPHGLALASGGGDAVVRFWDATMNTPKHTCAGHASAVLATAWAPDGALFASGDLAGEVRVWVPATGREACRPLRGHTSWVTSIAWEPLHASTSETGACELFATSSKDGTARVWNARTGATQFVLSGHTDSVESVRWGGEGLIFTASRDRTILVWAVEEGKARAKVVRTLAGHGHRVNALAMSTDHACRSGPYSHERLTFATPALARDAARVRFAAALAAAGGRELLVSCSDDLTLILWHPSGDKKPLARLAGHQAPVNHISYSPDGRYIASASFDKKVKLWDGRTGKFLVTFVGHVGSVYQVAWAPDSRFLASASKDSTVKVWPAAAKDSSVKPVATSTLAGHADEVFALDWAPAGETLASGSKDRLVKMCAAAAARRARAEAQLCPPPPPPRRPPPGGGGGERGGGGGGRKKKK